jgi:hypothetical protein
MVWSWVDQVSGINIQNSTLGSSIGPVWPDSIQLTWQHSWRLLYYLVFPRVSRCQNPTAARCQWTPVHQQLFLSCFSKLIHLTHFHRDVTSVSDVRLLEFQPGQAFQMHKPLKNMIALRWRRVCWLDVLTVQLIHLQPLVEPFSMTECNF